MDTHTFKAARSRAFAPAVVAGTPCDEPDRTCPPIRDASVTFAPGRARIVVTHRVDLGLYLFVRALLSVCPRPPTELHVEFRTIHHCFDSGVGALIALDQLSGQRGMRCVVHDADGRVETRARPWTRHLVWTSTCADETPVG